MLPLAVAGEGDAEGANPCVEGVGADAPPKAKGLVEVLKRLEEGGGVTPAKAKAPMWEARGDGE